MFKIPTTVTYAIFAALDLALRYGEGPVQARVIARRQTIPPRFIEQVLHALKQGGVVDSIRGPQGGYVLRHAPSAVSLAAIVETVNGQAAPDARDAPDGQAADARDADMNGRGARPQIQESLVAAIWRRVHRAERDVLNAVTLQSLLEQYTRLEQERAPMYHI